MNGGKDGGKDMCIVGWVNHQNVDVLMIEKWIIFLHVAYVSQTTRLIFTEDRQTVPYCTVPLSAR